MPHFKAPDNSLHFLDAGEIDSSEGAVLALLPPGSLEISEAEAEQLRNPPRPLADLVNEALHRIDGDTDRIYLETIGARGEEYRQAEADAQQFKASGYAGGVPAFVADHQAAKAAAGWTAKQAADDILATAVAWRSAQAQIRATRLQCKELARQAVTAAGVQAALQQWSDFVVAVRGALGLPTS
jgi:hypothetical protein